MALKRTKPNQPTKQEQNNNNKHTNKDLRSYAEVGGEQILRKIEMARDHFGRQSSISILSL